MNEKYIPSPDRVETGSTPEYPNEPKVMPENREVRARLSDGLLKRLKSPPNVELRAAYQATLNPFDKGVAEERRQRVCIEIGNHDPEGVKAFLAQAKRSMEEGDLSEYQYNNFLKNFGQPSE